MPYQSRITELPKREVSYSVSILLKEQIILINEYNRIWSIKQHYQTKTTRTTNYVYKRKIPSPDLEQAMDVIYERIMEIESAIKILESLGH